MADVKISALSAAVSAGATVYPGVQANETKKFTRDQVVSAEQAARVSADNVLSNAISVVSQSLSVLSQKVSADDAALSGRIASILSVDLSVHSQQLSVLSQAVSVLSQQASVISNKVSLLEGASAKSAGGTSVKGLQSIVNALSNRISIGGGAGSVTSDEFSVGAAALSARVTSVLTVDISAVSQAVSVGDAALSGRLQSILSVDLSVHSQKLSILMSGLSARSAGVSTRGMQSILDALSQGISVVSQATSAGDAALSARLQSILSADLSAHSQAISILSQQVSVLSQTVSVHSQRFSTIRGGTTGQVLKKIDAADFNWNWDTDLTGGAGGSVTSDELSAAAATLSSRIASVLTVDVSVLSQQVSTLVSQVSVISQALSAGDAGLSLRIASVLSVDISVISQKLSTVVSQVSVISQALSAGDAGLSLRIQSVLSVDVSAVSARLASIISVDLSIHSQTISVHSQRFSTLRGGLTGQVLKKIDAADFNWNWDTDLTGGAGGSVTSDELSAKAPWPAAQYRIVSDLQSTINSALVDVSGLVLTVAAAETWRVEGQLYYSTSASNAGLRFGVSVPPLSTPRFMHGFFVSGTQSAAVAGGGAIMPVSGPSIMVSITSVTAGGVNMLRFLGIFNVASAGTFRIMYAGIASTAASSGHVIAGSYMLAFRLV